jgi:phosphoribosylaminoimidazole-succinocarboxamide synthase
VEVVVRGHITGVTDTSLWTRYAAGRRVIDGYDLPDGLRKNDELPRALITPTTKAAGAGGHDEPLSPAAVVDRGLVDRRCGTRVQAALALFERGRQVAADAGLILADTKYEFGLGPDGSVLLIDEACTPRTPAATGRPAPTRSASGGQEPESLDKEPVRQGSRPLGYRGDGDPPTLPAGVDRHVGRYITAFERLTGTAFQPGAYPVGHALVAHLDEEGIL